MAAGFLSAHPLLGRAAGQRQAGYRTPLPIWPLGGTEAVIKAGFRNPLPIWPLGGGVGADPVPEVERNKGSHSGRILQEDEEIMALIMAYMRTRD